MVDPRIEEVLDFWFARCGDMPAKISARMSMWFAGSEALDKTICEKFGNVVELASSGELEEWAATPRGRLALIIVLDQFRRNVHRGAAAAFALDHVAEQLASHGMQTGMDKKLMPIERTFFYMTLEHCEDIDVQDRCVEVFKQLEADVPPSLADIFRNFTDYAVSHRDIIARFGRFPHRNAVLGRDCTAEEDAYLSGDAPTFGQ